LNLFTHGTRPWGSLRAFHPLEKGAQESSSGWNSSAREKSALMFVVKGDRVKRILCVLIPMLLVGCATSSVRWRSLKDSELIVRKVSLPLPHDAKAREEHLFKNYTGKVIDSGFGIGVLAKVKTRSHLESVLLQKARQVGADDKSLKAVFEVIFLKGSIEDQLYVPFAAYETNLDDEPVWIVMLSWEDFNYVAAYAYDQRTLKRVGLTVYM
jgi:hypothetical protein